MEETINDFKEIFIGYTKRLSDIKAKMKEDIKDDLSNYISLQNSRANLFCECRDLIIDIAMVRDKIQCEYYSYLGEVADNYTEREIPLRVKGDSKYQSRNRRKIMIELLLEDAYATQKFVDNRSFDLKGAYEVFKVIREITSGG